MSRGDQPPERAHPLAIAAGAMLAPLAAILFWTRVDDVPLGRAFDTPIPYMLFALSWLVGLPVYFLLANWLKLRIERFLLVALVPALAPLVFAHHLFLPPRAAFSSFLLLGTPAAAVLTFWTCLKLLSCGGREPPIR